LHMRTHGHPAQYACSLALKVDRLANKAQKLALTSVAEAAH
jgi:hypothetical protein